MFKLLSFLTIVLLFSGCDNEKLDKKSGWENIKGFETDNLDLALEVFKKDCKARKVNTRLKKVCKKSFDYTNGKDFFTTNFKPITLLNKKGNSQGLITGYYEPMLNGSFTKTKKYKYPIYKTPKDLITVRLSSVYPALKKYTLRGKIVGSRLVPYETRKDIDKNDDKLVPLLYVDNKIDKFFLEIQGSGKVKLASGKVINVAYAQQNGRKYYPIGRKLIEKGYIKRKDISLQSIRQWCEENPTKVDEVLNLNNSVVFFRQSSKTATGSLGIELVAKRNIAVDRSVIPLGFPVFVNTTNPITNENIDSLMIAADTGGAIKGDIRADFFWGNGDKAKLYAGKMAQKGILTMLIPKEKKIVKRWSNDTKRYIKVKATK